MAKVEFDSYDLAQGLLATSYKNDQERKISKSEVYQRMLDSVTRLVVSQRVIKSLYLSMGIDIDDLEKMGFKHKD